MIPVTEGLLTECLLYFSNKSPCLKHLKNACNKTLMGNYSLSLQLMVHTRVCVYAVLNED